MQCNRNKLAEILGRDVKTIDRMVESGMPYLRKPDKKRGQIGWLFDTVQVLHWMSGDQYAAQVKGAKIRLATANAGLKELEYAERVGDQVRVVDVVDKVAGGDAIVKSRLLAMPGRLAHLVAVETNPQKIEQMIGDEIQDLLAQLNKHWTERG